jgi:hypothetical protein
MAPNGSRRLVACGFVPHTRSRRRNTRLGTPSKAWLTALCLLLFALPVSAASEARQTDDCASRVASALTPVPPEDVTPAMRAGLVEACEGVVAALAAAPAAAGVDPALRDGSEAVRRLPSDPDAPLPAPTPKPTPETRPRAPGSALTGLTTPSALPTRVPTLENTDARRDGLAVSASSFERQKSEAGDGSDEKTKEAPSAAAAASFVVAGAGALVVVLAAAWPRGRGGARAGMPT